ncbi:DUF6192 family protein [Streptomyces sp. Tue6028]|uniref:DUF6192 family protein n=1 Tax=Streptomyces sp. Tue6028 TaxID=2036037 RepID=UPI003D7573AD
MRYADGGGLTRAGRRRREAVRIQAAELFEQNIKPPDIARRLRVSLKSAYQWHQLWRDGGVQALASRGPSGSRCRLSPRCLVNKAQFDRFRRQARFVHQEAAPRLQRLEHGAQLVNLVAARAQFVATAGRARCSLRGYLGGRCIIHGKGSKDHCTGHGPRGHSRPRALILSRTCAPAPSSRLDPVIAPVWSSGSIEPLLGMSVPVDDDTLVRR